MVDQEARRKYAELVRQFISGRMTNDEYEEKYDAITPDENDPAVEEAYHRVWSAYDDLKTHRMTGVYRLDRDGHRAIAQVVLFLQSDEEYRWPKEDWLRASRVLLLVALAAVAGLLLGLFPGSFSPIISTTAFVGVVLFTYYTILIAVEKRQWEGCGDTDAWPFLHRSDLDEAARNPRLLNSGRQAGH